MIKQHEFDQKVTARMLCFMINTQNEYLGSFYFHQLQKKVGLMARKFYFDEINFEAIKEYLSVADIFAQNKSKMVLIKTDKKNPTKKQLQELIAFCCKKQNYLYVLYTGDDGHFGQDVFAHHQAQWMRLFEPSQSQIIKHLQTLFPKISVQEIQEVFYGTDGHFALCVGELKKLTIFKSVSANFKLQNSENLQSFEQLFFDLLMKKEPRVIIKQLLKHGESEIALLIRLSQFIYRATLFGITLKLTGSCSSKAVLGYFLPKNLEDIYRTLGLKITLEKLCKTQNLTLETQLLLKENKIIQKEAFLVTHLIKLQEICR